MTIRAYSFHGWNLRVSAEAPVHDALHARLGRFPVGEPHDVAGLHLEFQPVTKTGGTELRRPAGAGRPVLAFGQGEVVYFDDSEQLYFEVPGRGQALCEATVYDPDSGQALAGSFMDYAMPRADGVPAMTVLHQETPCTTNPIGVKGTGEAGTTAAPCAIVNAIANALPGDAAAAIQMPLTAQTVWRALWGCNRKASQ